MGEFLLRGGSDRPSFPGSVQHVAPLWCAGGGNGQRERVSSGTEPESRGGLGCLQERVEAGRGPWWGAGGQPQVAQNLDDHGGIFDGGQERQRATALGTGGEVDGEDAFE